MWVSRTR